MNEDATEGDFAPKVSKELHFFLIYTWTSIYPRGSRSCKKKQWSDSSYAARSFPSLLRLSESECLAVRISRCTKIRERSDGGENGGRELNLLSRVACGASILYRRLFRGIFFRVNYAPRRARRRNCNFSSMRLSRCSAKSTSRSNFLARRSLNICGHLCFEFFQNVYRVCGILACLERWIYANKLQGLRFGDRSSLPEPELASTSSRRIVPR